MTISNRNIVEKQPVVLDPSFFLPPDVVDVRYINDQDTAGIYADPAGDSASNDEAVDVVVVDGESPINDVVSAPSVMTVVSQTVGVAPDGRFVVDVEIEVDDIPGVANFEVRLTKV